MTRPSHPRQRTIREFTLEEMLADPLIRLVMARDGVKAREVRALMERSAVDSDAKAADPQATTAAISTRADAGALARRCSSMTIRHRLYLELDPGARTALGFSTTNKIIMTVILVSVVMAHGPAEDTPTLAGRVREPWQVDRLLRSPKRCFASGRSRSRPTAMAGAGGCATRRARRRRSTLRCWRRRCSSPSAARPSCCGSCG